MPFTPTITALTGATYVSVTSPKTAATGNFTYTVGATCTAPNPTHGTGTYLPAAGEWTFGNVAVNIIDQTVSDTDVITTLTDVVGAQESLLAQTVPSAAAAYMENPITWVIPSNPNVLTPQVAAYTQSDTAASVTLPVNVNANPLVFYPTASYDGSGETSKLTFQASNGAAGTAYHASIGYTIDTPTLNSVSAPVGEVAVGSNTQCFCTAIEADGPGIQWTASWTSPNSLVHGHVGMTQIASIDIYDTFVSGNPGKTFYDYPPSVDSGPQYGQPTPLPQTATLSAGSHATYQALDDPYVALRACLSEVWPSEQFTDYFTFLPDPKGSYVGIPVTLGTMTWQWDAQTFQSKSGEWSLPTIVSPIASTALSPSTTLPIWYNNAQAILISQGVNSDC